MDDNKNAIIKKRVNRVMEALNKNNMQSFFAENKQDVVKIVGELMKDGDTVTVGGSMSLFECGVINHLKNGRYNYLDRYVPGLNPEQLRNIYLGAFDADIYLCSANAITENGELFNVDGNSNRVAAICYGPKSVIIIAGYNKIVKNLDDAIKRVKMIAAPANCMRLSSETYCKEKGECMAYATGKKEMTAGCAGPGRICCNYVVSAYQRNKDRIKVILVGEDLGY